MKSNHRIKIGLLISVLAVLLSLGGSSVSTAAPHLQQPVEDDFYYANGERIPVLVWLDRIGVIAYEGIREENIQAFAKELGLSYIGSYPGQLFILGFAEPRSRQELVQLQRDVLAEGQERQLIFEAGLIISHTADPETPILVPDLFIAQFHPNVSRTQIMDFNAAHNVEIVSVYPFAENQYLLRPKAGELTDSLTLSKLYEESELAIFSHPNFWILEERFETIPTDPFFGNQWHHRNTGASSGTVDADVDTSWAWDITMGNANVLIAVIDDGFDLAHQDLAPNLFTNPGEVAGNGIDDDGNGFIDDVNGWDVVPCAVSAVAGCGDNNPSPGGAGDNHGTAVAGVALARGNNAIGVSGSCPNCRLLPIRRGYGAFPAQGVAFAIDYARVMGAEVINNSWGQTSTAGVSPTVVTNALQNAANAGSLIFFAGGNGNSAGWCGASYPSLNNSVIAVSSTTNQDRKVTEAAFGNCIDLMTSSHRGYNMPYMGTLNVTTVDRTGAAGYNNASPPPLTCAIAEPGDQNYTHCFGGTSSASPLAAGVAGLIRSVNTSMTRQEVQRLLQDTTDKVEPGVAAYSTTTGFSTPGGGTATHSWGRLNAYEAVRIAAPVAQGGKSGVDVFIRDNRLDWGNTTGYLGEQSSNVLYESTRGFIPHWQSVDIKIDREPYQTAPTTSAQFDAFVDENPAAGAMNRVYVRVRNRGPVANISATVKLHWTFAGTGLPPLPPDFWTAFPADSSNTGQIHPIGAQTINNLAYSGSSVAGTGSDAAQIVQFNFNAPAIDPTQPDPDHFCLFVVIDSAQDPIDPQSKARFVIDSITPNDNNITHRNVTLEDTGTTTSFERWFYVRNPYPEPISTRLLLYAPQADPFDWRIELTGFKFNETFELEPGQEVLVKLSVGLTGLRQAGELTIVQERLDTPETPEVLGGLTFYFAPQGHTLFFPTLRKD